MGLEGEGSGVKGGGKWGERGREVWIGYPPVHPLILRSVHMKFEWFQRRRCLKMLTDNRRQTDG